MKPTSKTLSWAFVIILLAVGIFTGLGVILMHKQPLVLQGQAEATEIRISGKLPGTVSTLSSFGEGDWVHRGDTLVVINSPRSTCQVSTSECLGTGGSTTEQENRCRNPSSDRGYCTAIME